MPAIAVLAAAAAAWCFLQVDSRHLDALAGGAALNNANFLDNDQWLSTVSQYDRDKYWNRFRDVSTAATSPGGRKWGETRGGCRSRGGRSKPAMEVYSAYIWPERNFKENLEGWVLLRVTCSPGVCTCRINAAFRADTGHEP